MSPPRSESDEAYVLRLCDEVLGLVGQRQRRFSFMRGDSRDGRLGMPLPVDVYYPSLNLVIEYRERQHIEAVEFFDKPNKMTVSGVPRSQQREVYDQRRRDILPKHNIALVEVLFNDLAHDGRGRLLRNREADKAVIDLILNQWSNTGG